MKLSPSWLAARGAAGPALRDSKELRGSAVANRFSKKLKLSCFPYVVVKQKTS